MSDELGLASALELAESIRAKAISSRELLELFLRRIERLNKSINAIVTFDIDRATDAAKRADDELANNPDATRGKPLYGLPTTIKDAIETEGIRSTGGAAELQAHTPTADAPAVSRLRAAGAIVFGKTNVPTWSADVQTYNALFGVTNNPWDLTRTTGGSSGGAAAAVATGLTSFELGTDIGGSVRIPSNFCGVFGHKPSYGIVSQRGYLDRVGGGTIDADINVFGPIARSAADLQVLLDVLAGPNADDATAWQLHLPPPRHDHIGAYRVGTWLDDPAAEVATDVVDQLQQAADALAKAGAQVTDARPNVEMAASHRLFQELILPAISVSYDSVIGDPLSGYHRAWLDHTVTRAALRRVWAEWFTQFDVLLCPVMPMAAFPHDHHGTINDRTVTINGRTRPMGDTLAWTGLIGVACLPSTVAPVGRTPDGLPVGIQIVGPYLEDRTPLFVAAELAQLTDGYAPPPGA